MCVKKRVSMAESLLRPINFIAFMYFFVIKVDLIHVRIVRHNSCYILKVTRTLLISLERRTVTIDFVFAFSNNDQCYVDDSETLSITEKHFIPKP